MDDPTGNMTTKIFETSSLWCTTAPSLPIVKLEGTSLLAAACAKAGFVNNIGTGASKNASTSVDDVIGAVIISSEMISSNSSHGDDSCVLSGMTVIGSDDVIHVMSTGGSSIGVSTGGSSSADVSTGGSSDVGVSIGGSSSPDVSNGGSSSTDVSNGGSSIADVSNGGSRSADVSTGGSSDVDVSTSGSRSADVSTGGSSSADVTTSGSSALGVSTGGSSDGAVSSNIDVSDGVCRDNISSAVPDSSEVNPYGWQKAVADFKTGAVAALAAYALIHGEISGSPDEASAADADAVSEASSPALTGIAALRGGLRSRGGTPAAATTALAAIADLRSTLRSSERFPAAVILDDSSWSGVDRVALKSASGLSIDEQLALDRCPLELSDVGLFQSSLETASHSAGGTVENNPARLLPSSFKSFRNSKGGLPLRAPAHLPAQHMSRTGVPVSGTSGSSDVEIQVSATASKRTPWVRPAAKSTGGSTPTVLPFLTRHTLTMQKYSSSTSGVPPSSTPTPSVANVINTSAAGPVSSVAVTRQLTGACLPDPPRDGLK